MDDEVIEALRTLLAAAEAVANESEHVIEGTVYERDLLEAIEQAEAVLRRIGR